MHNIPCGSSNKSNQETIGMPCGKYGCDKVTKMVVMGMQRLSSPRTGMRKRTVNGSHPGSPTPSARMVQDAVSGSDLPFQTPTTRAPGTQP